MDWIADPRDGLSTVCKFLPTPADIHEFLRTRKANNEKAQAKAQANQKSYISYQYLDCTPWKHETPEEDRKAVVIAALGYDPRDKRAPRQQLEKPSTETVDALLANLQTPPSRPSKYLLNEIARQDAQRAAMDAIYPAPKD